MNDVNHLTPEVLAFVGQEGPQVEAPDRVELGSIRRYAQAIMDDDRIYWDEEAARSTRYCGVVAPPLYPMFAFRRPAGTPDPFDEAQTNPHYDGSSIGMRTGLPPIPLPLTRMLNGGSEVEFYRCARVGDRILAKSRYLSVTQKQGKDGPMVFIRMETRFTNQEGELLLVNIMTSIRR